MFHPEVFNVVSSSPVAPGDIVRVQFATHPGHMEMQGQVQATRQNDIFVQLPGHPFPSGVKCFISFQSNSHTFSTMMIATRVVMARKGVNLHVFPSKPRPEDSKGASEEAGEEGTSLHDTALLEAHTADVQALLEVPQHQNCSALAGLGLGLAGLGLASLTGPGRWI